MDTERFRELEEIYNNTEGDNNKIDALVDMAMEVRNYDIERGLAMGDEIIKRSRDAKYRLGIGRGLNLRGWCLWQQGNYDEGQDVLQEAYGIARSVKNKALEARVLNNFGYIYRDRGELSTSLNYFENALVINEELGDEVAQAVNLASIAAIHYDLNDYENALEFALKGIPVFQSAHDIYRLTSLYHILGNIYFKQAHYNEALHYFSEELKHTGRDTALHIMAMSGLGKVYYRMQEKESAEKYLREALHMAEQIGHVEVQITCHYYLGRQCMDEDSYRRSAQELNRALTLAEEYSRRHDIMSINETLSELYDKMGDIPKAFHHLKKFEQLKEEIFQQATLNKLRNLQARQQLELATKEKQVAEQTANLKQQFMANMSHEIRTPMNAIVGMTRLLLEKTPSPEQLRYLHAIRQSADNLLVIINDILDLSKIEAGKIIIEQTDFSLKELVQSVTDMLMLKAEEKKIELKFSVDPALPDCFTGDPTRISQVLINLAGNAIKFTEHGYVSIEARLIERKEENAIIRFDVVDTGIGIAPDYVDKIFESFTQAGTDTARKYGGTGLGLTISRQMTMLMHGDIFVHSDLGKGTTFSVVLPLPVAKEQLKCDPDRKEEDKAPGSTIGKISILLVEDNEFNRMVAEDTLQSLLPEATVQMAENGQEAVDAITKTLFDVVLMDIQMPVMDGVTATRHVREKINGKNGKVPIIAMTANVLQEDVKGYFEAGMNGYISKPFQPAELLQKISQLVHQDEVPDEAEIMPVNEPAPEKRQKVTDKTFLNGFTGGNEEKVHKYVGMFLSNAPMLLDKIESSLSAKDYPDLKVAAHSLKPQLNYMGVKEEVSNIYMIERSAGELQNLARLPELVKNLRLVCEQAFEELREEVTS